MKKILFLTLTIFFFQSCFFSWVSIEGWSWWSTEDIEKAQDTHNESVRIFALGDSLTAWFGLPLDESYPSQLQWLLDETWWNYKVINAGVSGNTSAELKTRMNWVLSDAQVNDIAILVIGGNDWLRGMNLWDLESNIEEIIEELKNHDMRIVLWGMQIPPNLWLSYTRDFEILYKNIAKKHRDIYFLDFFLEWVAWERWLNLPDGIHPNRQWYEIVSKQVYSFLLDNRLIWSR